MTTIQCKTCKKLKNTSEFYKNRTHSSGYGTQCKVCVNETKYREKEAKSSYMQDPVVDNKKICNKCKKDLDIAFFWVDNRRWNGLSSFCSDCLG